MKELKTLWTFLQEVLLENICRFGLLAVILLAFLEVVRRYFFGQTFLWYQDVAVYFNLALVFLYFGVAQRHGSHIRLDIIIAVLARKGDRYKRHVTILETLGSLVSLIICTLFVWVGIDFVQVGMDFGRRTDNAELLLWPFYLLLVVGFVILSVEYVIAVVKRVGEVKGGKDSC